MGINTIKEYKDKILEPIDNFNTSNYKELVDNRNVDNIKVLEKAHSLYLDKLKIFCQLVENNEEEDNQKEP